MDTLIKLQMGGFNLGICAAQEITILCASLGSKCVCDSGSWYQEMSRWSYLTGGISDTAIVQEIR